MSKNLESLKGLIESNKDSGTKYTPTTVELTTFYGGSVRGKSLQIGFKDENDNYSHVQLSNEEVLDLLYILKQEFKE